MCSLADAVLEATDDDLIHAVLGTPVGRADIDEAALAAHSTCATYTVDAGDVLFLPSASVHNATALDAGSIHLTFALKPKTRGARAKRLARAMELDRWRKLAEVEGEGMSPAVYDDAEDDETTAGVDFLEPHHGRRLCCHCTRFNVACSGNRMHGATQAYGSGAPPPWRPLLMMSYGRCRARWPRCCSRRFTRAPCPCSLPMIPALVACSCTGCSWLNPYQGNNAGYCGMCTGCENDRGDGCSCNCQMRACVACPAGHTCNGFSDLHRHHP